MTLQHLQALSTTGPILPGEVRVTKNTYTPGEQVIAALSNVVYLVPHVRLTGHALIAHTKQYPEQYATKSDLVAASGYVRPDGKLAFTAFYEALLEAKEETDPGWNNRMDAAVRDTEDAEYEALSVDSQRLYDISHERLGRNWDHDDIMNFVEELSDIGITTVEEFNDAYWCSQDNTWRWQEDFAQAYCEELHGDLDDRLYASCIDWSQVWRDQLDSDFNAIELDGEVHIFRAL